MPSDPYLMVRRKALEFAYYEKEAKVRANPGTSCRGERIAEYLASIGITWADDYCVAFVYWCYQRASGMLGVPNLLYKTGGTTELRRFTNPRWFLQPSDMPEPGDIWVRRDKPHVGLVWEVKSGRSKVYTIEANTYTSMDPRYGVHRRIRNLNKNTWAIIRPAV